MIRRPPRSTLSSSSAASDVYKRQGNTNAEGCLDSIKSLSESLRVPIIAKETGAGISREAATLLKEAGASAIDVSGDGGTSWVKVETYRAQKDPLLERLGDLYSNWGIHTAISILESLTLPVIGTGGIRHGLHVAKAIALGASLCGIGSVSYTHLTLPTK